MRSPVILFIDGEGNGWCFLAAPSFPELHRTRGQGSRDNPLRGAGAAGGGGSTEHRYSYISL